MNLDKIYIFSEQFKNLIENKIRVGDALNILHQNEEDKKFKQILKKISKDVSSGKTLYEAFLVHKKIFEQGYIALIKIGENSDSLAERMEDICQILKAKIDNRRKLLNLLLPNILVLVVAFLVVSLLIQLVLPNFISIFESNDQELPSMTKSLLYIYNHFLYICILIIISLALIFIINMYINKNKKYKFQKDKFILKLPFLKTYIKKNMLYIFIKI